MRQRIFNTWLNRAHSRLIDNEQHVSIELSIIRIDFLFLKIVAERHYFRTIIVRAWLSWRQLIDERHNEERSERIAIQFYYYTIERRTLNAWKLVKLLIEFLKNIKFQSL
jgi:hypothetical protein